ncbi:MAG: tRNA (N(6)-L-threonylcarbamoyladenosine(37)-C(2))-methylthiotransferase MtaB [Victivallales bacterium]|nr:tRNA (N(6)-L-threonylcarbamoyladenosine(37)-C(2))-methylthiotransferase MtaB [Victivallales bacterium]
MTEITGNAAVFTLGCRLNQADSALICGRLKADNWRIVRPEYDGRIDLLVINTCIVTAAADRKSRQAARRFRERHPEACIVLTGCSAEIENSAWSENSAVDIVLTNPEKKQITSRVWDFLEKRKNVQESITSLQQPAGIFQEHSHACFPFKSRAFLKVQEGCNNFCTYCIVPYTRGPERSRDWNEIVAGFRDLLEAGFHEIVLTGVNICAYNDRGRNLNALLDRLCTPPGDFRIRLSSTEPHPDNIALLETMAANPRICRFLHLSLQHGCDRILKLMGRKYTTCQFAAFIREARRLIPDIHLGTDIIVGFPGETDADFAAEMNFVREMNFANMHIFTYSPRRGTPAAGMPGQVPVRITASRRRQLEEAVNAMKTAFAKSQLGKVLPVIFERKNRSGRFQGWSDNYINILSDSPEIAGNRISYVKAEEITPDGSIAGKVVTAGRLNAE